jgi:cytochrome c556
MKTRSRILTTTTALFAVATLAACSGGGTDPEAPGFAAYKHRDSVMHLLAEKTLVINGMAREEIELDEAEFVAATRHLAALSEMMLEGFEDQTLVAESRTEPAVWENWDDFESKANALVDAANDLAQAAASGGFEAARGSVQDTVSNCGSCHRAYRAPEDE